MIVLWPLLLLVAAVVLFCTVKWYWALAALVLLVPAPYMTYEWFEQMRRLASAWRYCGKASLQRQKDALMKVLDDSLKTI